MRIVQFANFYAPTSGGLRTCVEELGRGYTELGHQRILVVPGIADADEETPAGRRVTIASPPMFGSSEYRMVTDRRRMLRLLDAVAPDVLEISDKMSVPWLTGWARRHDVPTVLFSHERLDAILRSRVPRWLPLTLAADVVNRALRKRVDALVVASAFAAAEFERAGVGDARRIPLGVDLNTFHPSAREESTRDGHVELARERSDGGVELVLVSRLSQEKDPLLAVQTLHRLADLPARLTIVGDGPLRAQVEALCAGLPVRFAGHVTDRATLAGLVAGADIALCPSSAETFGLATVEALACGTPVVVPYTGALAEFVGDPAAGSVCAPTPESFADGVRRLLTIPTPVRRAAARAMGERYPWSATVASLLNLHASLTGRPARPSASTAAHG
jgi:alpha-1,6-mannosyltransferase